MLGYLEALCTVALALQKNEDCRKEKENSHLTFCSEVTFTVIQVEKERKGEKKRGRGGRKVAKDIIRNEHNFNVTWELAHCNMCVITRQSQGTNSHTLTPYSQEKSGGLFPVVLY